MRVGTNSKQSAQQRAGRAARIRDGVVVRLGEDPREDKEAWELPYSEALHLAAQQLQYPGPIAGVPEPRRMSLVADLVNLGLCVDTDSCFHALTALGHVALRGHMDIRQNLLVHIGRLWGIEKHASIAAVFIQQQVDLFETLMLSLEQQGPLTAEQHNMGLPEGDIHTAVWWYLCWVDGSYNLPDRQKQCLKMLCITKMRDQLYWMKVRVHDPRGLKYAPGWRENLRSRCPLCTRSTSGAGMASSM